MHTLLSDKTSAQFTCTKAIYSDKKKVSVYMQDRSAANQLMNSKLGKTHKRTDIQTAKLTKLSTVSEHLRSIFYLSSVWVRSDPFQILTVHNDVLNNMATPTGI